MATRDAGRMHLGLPVTTLRAMVAQAEQAGQERLYLTLPTSMLQEAVAEAVAGRGVEVAGHSASAAGIAQDELILDLDLDDETFDVAGRYARW